MFITDVIVAGSVLLFYNFIKFKVIIDLKAILWHEKYTFRAIFLLNRNNEIFIYIRGKL